MIHPGRSAMQSVQAALLTLLVHSVSVHSSLYKRGHNCSRVMVLMVLMVRVLILRVLISHTRNA